LTVEVDIIRNEYRRSLRAFIDTGAFSVWMDRDFFEATGGNVDRDYEGASDVSGRPIEIVGKGYTTFQIWGHNFEGYATKIMKKLPSRMLIRRKF